MMTQQHVQMSKRKGTARSMTRMRGINAIQEHLMQLYATFVAFGFCSLENKGPYATSYAILKQVLF
jgi:hypothetical protein